MTSLDFRTTRSPYYLRGRRRRRRKRPVSRDSSRDSDPEGYKVRSDCSYQSSHFVATVGVAGGVASMVTGAREKLRCTTFE